jgi:hypothetical protein
MSFSECRRSPSADRADGSSVIGAPGASTSPGSTSRVTATPETGARTIERSRRSRLLRDPRPRRLVLGGGVDQRSAVGTASRSTSCRSSGSYVASAPAKQRLGLVERGLVQVGADAGEHLPLPDEARPSRSRPARRGRRARPRRAPRPTARGGPTARCARSDWPRLDARPTATLTGGGSGDSAWPSRRRPAWRRRRRPAREGRQASTEDARLWSQQSRRIFLRARFTSRVAGTASRPAARGGRAEASAVSGASGRSRPAS